MPLVNVLIKAELVSDIHKAKLANLFSTICWILNFCYTHIHPFSAHHFVCFLSDSVRTWTHIRRHSFLHKFKLGKPLSGRKSRGTNWPANETPAGHALWSFTFTVRTFSTTGFQACNSTIMLNVWMHALPWRVNIFALIINPSSFIRDLKIIYTVLILTLTSM